MIRPQPVCWICWDLRDLGVWPGLRSDATSPCRFCGTPARDGLWTVVDPDLVRYPKAVA